MATEDRSLNADWLELRQSPHIRAQAERVLPVVTLAHGTAQAPTLDHLIDNIAQCVLALRTVPEAPFATDGSIRVIRNEIGAAAFGDGPPENYEVAVVAATVFSFQIWAESHLTKEPADGDG